MSILLVVTENFGMQPPWRLPLVSDDWHGETERTWCSRERQSLASQRARVATESIVNTVIPPTGPLREYSE